ncbi:MAG: ATP-binding protein [Chitinophagaceae bacterium]
MPNKSKKLRYIYLIYWFLLTYIIAALVWWFVALNNQTRQMNQYKINELVPTDKNYTSRLNELKAEEVRKTTQYIGEGSIFLLLILAGAVFVFRAVRRQLKGSQEQQHFMMALTHELKTPIAVAKLNLETLQKRKLDETQQQRLIQTTLQETNRLNALCNNMLLSSQIEAGGYLVTQEETNLSELIAECVQDFITRYPDRLILPDIKENLFINSDRLLLQMVVNNLIDNAIKYSPKESKITVRLFDEYDMNVLQVADEGKGIPDEEKIKIFKKFYRIGNQATKAAKGTGLGLYLTKKIVARHRGSITVTDHLPTGAIFTVTLHSTT